MNNHQSILHWKNAEKKLSLIYNGNLNIYSNMSKWKNLYKKKIFEHKTNDKTINEKEIWKLSYMQRKNKTRKILKELNLR